MTDTKTRTSNPERGRARAKAQGLLPIAEHWELHCEDCGYRDPEAYVVGVCPFCGGPRAGARLPPAEELLYALFESGLDVGEIAQAVGVSGNTVYRWQNENYDAVNFSTHERLAKFHRQRVSNE